ncbi:MAG: ligase-associated DNA damage response DEXH box helicase [Cytophagales bacterium]|nr:ligase-associated DNA damage response DEXH box helicase [Cytophagales bacterium]
MTSDYHKIFDEWYNSHNWRPFQFQKDTFAAYMSGYSGLVNAPTGSGKTYSLWIPILLHALNNRPLNGLQALWISPYRALAKDIQIAAQTAADELGTGWKIALRTGDTSAKEKILQKTQPSQGLITTPESLLLLFTQKEYKLYFAQLHTIVIDEWHELIGSKRGVQIELALSRLAAINPNLQIWGISATIGNLHEAMEVLTMTKKSDKNVIIKSNIKKHIDVISIMPDSIEHYPWGGHLGINLLHKVLPVIMQSRTTLLFTNTRAQAEIWYKTLIEKAPELSGLTAIHHGSLSAEIRTWVEQSLHAQKLKVVVCTSSLDLGVDFRPVDTVVQIGGTKGVSRFLQRAGRSGHRPGDTSKIYFVPTHSLELIEAAALRHASALYYTESRRPLIRTFDVLIQYLVTLALSDGFEYQKCYYEIISTHAFATLTALEWAEVIQFITIGGKILESYDEYHKVVLIENMYKVTSRRIATMHRLNMGTIVNDISIKIKTQSGKYLGSVEENFISGMKEGTIFAFAGLNLEFVSHKYNEAIVRVTTKKPTLIPAWAGGRMPFSSMMSEILQLKLYSANESQPVDSEIQALMPLFDLQKQISYLPKSNELLIEYLVGKNQNYHIFCYTFEGRYVNEGIASIVAGRISKIFPLNFSISMTDYGFELLTDQPIPIAEALEYDLFSTENIANELLHSLNATEMAKRKFRDIAQISGLIFTGYPGKTVKNKHLLAGSGNFYEAFRKYDVDNLLLKQAYEEVLYDQLDESRIRQVLVKINNSNIVLKSIDKPSPFCFPIMIERIREKSIHESLETSVEKILKQYKINQHNV